MSFEEMTFPFTVFFPKKIFHRPLFSNRHPSTIIFFHSNQGSFGFQAYQLYLVLSLELQNYQDPLIFHAWIFARLLENWTFPIFNGIVTRNWNYYPICSKKCVFHLWEPTVPLHSLRVILSSELTYPTWRKLIFPASFKGDMLLSLKLTFIGSNPIDHFPQNLGMNIKKILETSTQIF